MTRNFKTNENKCLHEINLPQLTKKYQNKTIKKNPEDFLKHVEFFIFNVLLRKKTTGPHNFEDKL